MSEPLFTVEVLTLFPDMFDSFLRGSLLGKAIEKGLIAVHLTNPRDYSSGKSRTVDDAPYGGGPGMVLRPGPIFAAIDAVENKRGRAHRVLLSPAGYLFDQASARSLSVRSHVLLVCGRYEGIDERVTDLLADQVLTIGDYVLSGGEVAAMVVIEAVTRLVPGVLGCGQSIVDESFTAGRLEHPHYTRPAQFRGLSVPAVLVSGDHAAVERWRRIQAIRRTAERRPDLLERYPMSEAEKAEQRALPDNAGRSRGPGGPE